MAMRWIWVLAAALLACPTVGSAAELGQPAGQVVLTVAGNFGATNRGPYDDFEDGFFKHHERKFDKAAAFDLAMLEGLGMHEVTVAYSGWPRTMRFEGPWLKDVLARPAAPGRTSWCWGLAASPARSAQPISTPMTGSWR